MNGNRTRRGRITGPLALAAALLATAASAHAAPAPIGGDHVDWGLKESFRNYITGPIAHGDITLFEGATQNGDGTFRWPEAQGSYDADAGTLDVSAEGRVEFRGHYTAGEPLLELILTGIEIELDGAAGILYADVTSKSLETGDPVSYTDVDLASLDLSAVTPVDDGETVTWSAVPATLTENGAEAFAGFYTAGTALDPVTIAARYGSLAKPPTITRAKGVKKVGKRGTFRIARLGCPAGPCEVDLPRAVSFKGKGGRSAKIRLLAPKQLDQPAPAVVKGRLGKRARAALGRKTRSAAVPIAVRAGEAETEATVKLRLRSRR